MSKDAAAHLDRVRKLLALATSPNVHEAALAAAKAQALIERYRLDSLLEAEASAEAEDAADPVTDGRDQPLERARKIRKWKSALAAGLARNNGCIAYSAPTRDRKTELLIAGRSADRSAVLALWEWLVPQIEWLSATHGAGQPRAWHEAFRIGAAETIVDRLAAARVEVHRAIGTEALARIEPTCAHRAAAVDRFADQRLRLRPGRRMRVDGEALDQGRALGHRVSLPSADD